MWWYESCILILCIFSKSSRSRILPKYAEDIKTIIDVQMIPEISYPVVHAFIHKKMHTEWSDVILQKYAKKIPIVLFETNRKVTKFSSSNRIKFHYVIAIFRNPSDINVHRWRIKVGDMWNSNSKFMIWFTGEITYQNTQLQTRISQSENMTFLNNFEKKHTLTLEPDALEKSFENYWSAGAANVVFSVFNRIKTNFDLMIFNPFVLLNDQKRGLISTVERNQTLFPDKFINLYGYPINISIFHKIPFANLASNHTEMVSGEDVEFIKTLKQKMNFTLKVKGHKSIAAEYKKTLPSGKHVGLTGDILLNKSEVLANNRYITVIYNQTLDYLYPYDNGPYYAVVPRRRRISNFHIVGKYWISNSTVIYLFPLLILTLYLYLRNDRYPILTTWNLVLNQRFLRIGSLNHDRIVRFTWIIFALLITCGFETRLVKLLTTTGHPNDIRTIEDLIQSNLTLLVGDKMFEPINVSSVPMMKELAKKTRTNLNFSVCSERLLNHGDVACATDKLSALLTLTHLFCLKRKFKARLMNQALGKFWITYVVKKDLPYLARFNTLLLRLTESGIKAWSSRKSTDLINVLWMKRSKKNTPTTLRIDHLKYALGICFTGLWISFIIFLREIYIGKKRSRKIMQQRTIDKIMYTTLNVSKIKV